jgi:endonuclease YncB( thermonuclease family)
MHNKKFIFLFLSIIIILSLYSLAYSNSSKIETGVVTNVVDGDTIDVKLTDTNKVERVRILYIDTFETKHTIKAKAQAYDCNLPLEEVVSRGEKAKEYTTKLLLGKQIGLIFSNKLDKYDRTLARIVYKNENKLEILDETYDKSLRADVCVHVNVNE